MSLAPAAMPGKRPLLLRFNPVSISKYPAPVVCLPSSSLVILSRKSLLMSHLAQPGQRAPSPGANANFASNNPFRRAASPLPSPDHRMSNNPFLDPPASSQQRQGGPNPFTEDIFVRVAHVICTQPRHLPDLQQLLLHKPQHFISRPSTLLFFPCTRKFGHSGLASFQRKMTNKLSQKDLSLLDKPTSGGKHKSHIIQQHPANSRIRGSCAP